MTGESKRSWRWGVVAASALAFVALVPQLHLWRERGRAWHGAEFSFYFDEAAYESYVNALVAGRPRLNDPYTGRDDKASAPQAESLFSIQFISAYAAALPARLFNISPAAVFIILWPLAAFATTLALTRLLHAVIRDEPTAATLALVVLCFCTFIQKSVRTLRGLETSYLPLPFLRRYLPALPFAFFFIFCLLVWRALTTDSRRASRTNAVFAGLTFTLLVYSYFYLWTTAAAWLACFALLWLVAADKRDERRRAARTFLFVGGVAALSLAPYAWLLARRAPTMNTVQALVHTRAPDLFRTSELLGALALVVLIIGAWRGRIAWRERGALLAASFALTPFAVFNQQLLTGRSLQPVHYEQFIANYVSLLSLTLACVLVSRSRAARETDMRTAQEPDARATRETGEGVAREINGRAMGETGGSAGRQIVGRAGVPRKVLAGVALVALGWASVEVVVATRRAAQLNLWVDEVRPVYLRLSEMARERGVEPEPDTGRPVVFCPDIALANRLPTVAPQAVLWAPHMFVFSGVTLAEEKERLYQQLYYSNIDAARFSDFISRPHPYRTAVFGSARVLNGLDANRAPITPADLDAETRAYAAYINSFTRADAARTPLSYVVTIAAAAQIDPGNIDRWYTRDAGERVGNYTIYRVKLRS
ncbi:MAG: hypothetical protein QOD32_720 [Pyrinomonadaceae bacterium]|jgi:hypothetical protein|nr:hypothetical protein [Pyrinomonadaceae bacterium]